MAAISAQGATITLGNVIMSDVIQYELAFAVNLDANEFGTVRIQALSNNSVTTRIHFTTRRRLVIKHGTATVFDAWVFPRAARVAAVRNDIVRYSFDFAIVSFPSFVATSTSAGLPLAP